MSDGNTTFGITDEIWATRISGTDPSGPVNVITGRNFIPAVSPNGKLAR